MQEATDEGAAFYDAFLAKMKDLLTCVEFHCGYEGAAI